MKLFERNCLEKFSVDYCKRYYTYTEDKYDRYIQVPEIIKLYEHITEGYILTEVLLDRSLIKRENILDFLHDVCLTNETSDIILQYTTDIVYVKIITINECTHCSGQGYELVNDRLRYCKECAGTKRLKVNIKNPFKKVIETGL